MKILKPGKVERRKFVCPDCESVLVIGRYEEAICPVCRERLLWHEGEPYEEPVQSDMDRLITVLYKNWAMDDEFADSVAQTLIANGVTFREG